MENKLTPHISETTFHITNDHSFSIVIRDAHIDLMSFPWEHCTGSSTHFTVYGLQESDFLKLAQACIDAANELRKQPVKEG
jgi:hypothetical protein